MPPDPRRATPVSAWILLGAATAAGAGPTTPRAVVPPGPYFVGQAIDLAVESPGPDRPAIVTPRVAGADVLPSTLRTHDGHPAARLRITPHRSGLLIIPPLTVRLGEGSGKTSPIRLTIRDLPATGRPANFLGGVGDLTIEAEARPTTLRVGDVLAYQIRLTGPGALGSTARPTLQGPALDAMAIRVDLLPTEVLADPPRRVLRYRLRPLRSGRGILPPVAVSTFDPRSERYLTRASPAIPIRVEEIPALDPRTVQYGPEDTATGPQLSSPALRRWALGAGVGLAACSAAILVARSLRRHLERSAPTRLARRLAREVVEARPAREAARRITDGLADYLADVSGRPVGALTPGEARREVAERSGDEFLGDRAAGIIAACDQLRYEGQGGETEAPVAEATELFRALAKVGRARRGEKPREAPPTAS